MTDQSFAAETGSRGVLHPGKLLWLRALGWMVLGFVLLMLSAIPGGVMMQMRGATGNMSNIAEGCVFAAAALAVYVAYVRLGERRWPHELDLRRLPELAAGLVLGAAFMSAVVGVLVLFDWVDLRSVGAASPVMAIGTSIQSGVVEELLLRAVVFRLLTRAFNVWWALAISSALFGALHLGNPDATAFGAFAIAVEAGILLAVFYVWTGRLWLSIGMHAAWNFFQGYVFGAPVSGTNFGPSPMDTVPDASDPDVLTGGIFGPEATLATIVLSLAISALVLWLARHRLRSAPPAPAALSKTPERAPGV